MRLLLVQALSLYITQFCSLSIAQTDYVSELSIEQRMFSDEGRLGQSRHQGSLEFQLDYSRTMNNGTEIFSFSPFIRVDANDSERTLFDLSDLSWIHVTTGWESRIGVRQVFWGVTESVHLVDIINQSDFSESLDGEHKLGQPMVNISIPAESGIYDFYWLIGHRTRPYSGREGRLGFPFPIENEIYESSAGQRRSDFAFRWAQYFGSIEVGLSYFSGTTREPRFELDVYEDGNLNLVPYYELIDQVALDTQLFVGDWVWKLEALSRSGQGDRFYQWAIGFEKSFVGIAGTRADLGLIVEHARDSRMDQITAIAENDTAVGIRLSFNDIQSTEVLLLGLYDKDSSEKLLTLEASRRIGRTMMLSIEGSLFRASTSLYSVIASLSPQDSELFFLDGEDYVSLKLTKYFD